MRQTVAAVVVIPYFFLIYKFSCSHEQVYFLSFTYFHIIDKLPVESSNHLEVLLHWRITMRQELTRNNQIHEVADNWLMFSNKLGECEQINTVYLIFIDSTEMPLKLIINKIQVDNSKLSSTTTHFGLLKPVAIMVKFNVFIVRDRRLPKTREYV